MVGNGSLWKVAGVGLGLAVWATLPCEAATGKLAVVVEGAPGEAASRIFLANADGSGLQAFSAGQGRDRAPSFSPDGRQVAYQNTNKLGLDQILIQGMGTTKPRLLGIGEYPQWSRDGKRILFSRRRLNDFGIYVAAADGSDNEEALKPIARGEIARWSPDEKRIALVTPEIEKGVDRWEIQVMPVGAQKPNFKFTLPEGFGRVRSLEWSPDGNTLLFTTWQLTSSKLHTLSLQSPEMRRLPAGDAEVSAGFGSWSPDGKEILFSAGPDMAGNGGASKLCVMKADGTDVRVIWDPASRGQEIRGTAWFAPPAAPAPAVVVAPMPPAPVKPAAPAPAAQPPVAQPVPPVQPEPPAPAVPRVLAAPKKVHSAKLFKIARERSPVSVPLAQPGENDFLISVNALPWSAWNNRRQGVGITLELEDGSLYRGNVIYSGGPWVTLQGRPKGAKVRLIDGKQLPAGGLSFQKGFKLTLRREGKNISLAINDQEVLARPVFTSGVKQVTLTLENFDPGTASFRLGGVYFQEVVPANGGETASQ